MTVMAQQQHVFLQQPQLLDWDRAILSAPHLVQRTSLFTIAGETQAPPRTGRAPSPP